MSFEVGGLTGSIGITDPPPTWWDEASRCKPSLSLRYHNFFYYVSEQLPVPSSGNESSLEMKVSEYFHWSYYHSGDYGVKAKNVEQIGEAGKGLDCAHPLVLNNRAPNSWESSIMKLEEGIEAPLFTGNGWANTSHIHSEAFKWLNLQKINSLKWGLKLLKVT